MEKQNQLPVKIQDLSEEQKLELFKVEELETRLEMAAPAAGGDIAAAGNKICWIG